MTSVIRSKGTTLIDLVKVENTYISKLYMTWLDSISLEWGQWSVESTTQNANVFEKW